MKVLKKMKSDIESSFDGHDFLLTSTSLQIEDQIFQHIFGKHGRKVFFQLQYFVYHYQTA